MTSGYPCISPIPGPRSSRRGGSRRVPAAGRRLSTIALAGGLWLALHGSAAATQTHGAPEGLVVHQIAHLFCAAAMGILIYWLRQAGLTRAPGWRLIQYAAVWLILWNLDTVAVHFLDEQAGLMQIRQAGTWHLAIETREGFAWLGILYYLLKLDHLFLVPALGCLYCGLRRLDREQAGSREPGPP